MKSLTFVAALLAGLITSSAANAVTYIIELDQGSINSYTVSTTVEKLSGNVSLSAPSLVTSGTAGVTTESVGSHHVAPAGINGASYVYVENGSNSSATFTLNAKEFGFTWGTIDSYNTLKLYASNDQNLKHPYVITGTDLLTILNQPNQNQQVDVLFTFKNDTLNIAKAVLTSSEPGFEVANVSTNAVPLPGAALLFGSGLVGLAGIARKKVSTRA